MKTRIRTPKTRTTLPHHEHAARRARAKALALPAVPRKPGRTRTAILPPAFHPSSE